MLQKSSKNRQVFRNYSIKERTVRRWFAKFNSIDFSLENEPRSGRPTVILNEDLSALTHHKWWMWWRKKCSSAFMRLLMVYRKVNKLEKRVPHDRSTIDRNCGVSKNHLLYFAQPKQPFFELDLHMWWKMDPLRQQKTFRVVVGYRWVIQALFKGENSPKNTMVTITFCNRAKLR